MVLKKLLTKHEEDFGRTKEAFELRLKFERIMFELGLVNKFNRTFALYLQSKTNYGYYGKLYLQPGLSFSMIKETNLFTIEENLACLWVMDIEKFKEYAEIKIITVPIDPNLCFENPHIKPWEMYLGLSFNLKPIINNNNSRCMFLIAGCTGSGKTRLIYLILLSFILSCTPQECGLWISDCAKDEYTMFRYCTHTRYYANEFEELLMMLQYLDTVMESRKKTISFYREKGIATNIEEYNQIPNIIKMSYEYILIDEASILMPASGESKEVVAMKQEILALLAKFSKTCRSYGIFPIIATQKTVKDEISPILKDMATVRISFRANNGKSSESILGDNSAVGLANRYAMYSLDGGASKDYLYSPLLTTQMLKDLLAPYIDRHRRKVNLEEGISAFKEKHGGKAKVVELKKDKKSSKKARKQAVHAYTSVDTSKVKEDEIVDY